MDGKERAKSNKVTGWNYFKKNGDINYEAGTDIIAFDLSCDPVGLHGVCEGDDLLAKVGGALDVDILVVDWHACVVHS